MRCTKVAAEQLLAVCRVCHIDRVHVFGHGLGGAAALHMAELLRPDQSSRSELKGLEDRPTPKLASLTLASPYGSLEDLRPMQQQRIRSWDELFPIDFEGGDQGMPADGQQCEVEATLLTGFPYREALLRVNPDVASAERLGGERLVSRLPDRSVPVMLLQGGTADAVDPSWDLRSRPDVRRLYYPLSGHLPFIDNREECLMDLVEFLDFVDGVKSPRGGLSQLESFTSGGRPRI